MDPRQSIHNQIIADGVTHSYYVYYYGTTSIIVFLVLDVVRTSAYTGILDVERPPTAPLRSTRNGSYTTANQPAVDDPNVLEGGAGTLVGAAGRCGSHGSGWGWGPVSAHNLQVPQPAQVPQLSQFQQKPAPGYPPPGPPVFGFGPHLQTGPLATEEQFGMPGGAGGGGPGGGGGAGLYGQYGCLHQCTILGCGASGGCAALRAVSLAPPVATLPLETQQQSGPVPGGGQHDVQNVIQVQSGPFPFVAQVE
jgi:hypothetical protein